MQIRVVLENETLNATLDDTAVARDFASLMPFEVTLSDYHSTEKVADLPRKLDISGAPKAYEPKAGDITHFAPWGNIAIFYRGFSKSSGLVRLGQFDGSIDALKSSAPFKARFELAD
ncbi:cyclophilin [Thalassospira sp. MA62]|nr:cyclophilin [Thalassospira sp. MA62]